MDCLTSLNHSLVYQNEMRPTSSHLHLFTPQILEEKKRTKDISQGENKCRPDKGRPLLMQH